MRFDIVREEDSRLRQRVWSFYPLIVGARLEVRCVRFSSEERETTGHKYKAIAGGSWFSSIMANSLKAADVPLPDDVIAEAKERVLAEAVVKVQG